MSAPSAQSCFISFNPSRKGFFGVEFSYRTRINLFHAVSNCSGWARVGHAVRLWDDRQKKTAPVGAGQLWQVGFSNLQQGVSWGDMARGRPHASESREWLQEGQKIERARWLLLRSIAQEYPEKMHELATLRKEWDAIRAACGHGVIAPIRIRAGYRYPNFFKAAWRWGVDIGLVEEVPEKSENYPFRHPQSWLISMAITLASDDICRALGSIQEACEHRTETFWLGLHSDVSENDPPEPPQVDSGYAETDSEYFDRVREAAKKYREALKAWLQENGFSPAQDWRREDAHFRWAAWRIVENLDKEAIAVREAVRQEAHDPLDAEWVEKRVKSILHLTGIVKDW